ncbi:uncharacterized protein [Triticum aestivum]|uniref:uncharacterized protein n=1 Tax=Triticum aestivum TaxID=4565 RepID=UPI001D020501|nr:uncharacterized protein LOC123083883 [Triticum aestivum]
MRMDDTRNGHRTRMRPATADALVFPRSATTSPTRQGTTWTLGFGLSPLLDSSTSVITGGRLDLGDEGGEGHGEEDINAVGLTGARSALGLVPVEFPSSVAQALLAANHNGHRCLSTECHTVADAVGHGCTAGALGLRPFLGTPARFLVGSISGATGLRGRVMVGALDMGDGDGEGEEDVTEELRFQDAHRHIQAVLHLIYVRSRIKTVVHCSHWVFYLLVKELRVCSTRSDTSIQRRRCTIGKSIGVMLYCGKSWEKIFTRK